MSDSFFTGTDAELYNGSNNFASIIETDFATYGISSAQNTNYQSLNTSYATAYEAILVPSTKNKALVAAKNAAKILLKVAASDLAKIIEGQSTITDDQKLMLGLNVRKTPAPVGEPGTPYKFTAALRPNGSLLMDWKCDNPTNSVGVIYQVYRTIDGGAIEYLGGAGKRQFIDSSIPMGTSTIIYTIQATRTTVVGVENEFTVKFGANSAGVRTAEVVDGGQKPTKVAA